MNKRVLLVSTGLGRGGAETQLLRLGRRLREAGAQVCVVSLIDHNAWSEELARWQLRYECLAISKRRPPVLPALRFARLVASFRPDVVLSFLFGANTLVQLARPVLAMPRVVSSIRSVIPPSGATPRVMRSLAGLADATVFNSVAVMEDAVTRGIYARERSLVIRNAVDTGSIVAAASERERVRLEWAVPREAWVWLAVGNVRPVKNYPALVRAFAEVAARDERAHLRIVGKPYGDVERMQAIAPALWDSGRVAYLGQRTDVPRQLAGADAYVLSSRFEGSPNTVIEAMAAGLPVVATEVGGVTELLAGGARGWPAEASTADAIGAAMTRLMEASAASRRARAEAGRAYVGAEHAPTRVFDAWCSVLFPDGATDGVTS